MFRTSVRQARIEYPGAVHHVRSRGKGGQPIFLDDRGRTRFLLFAHQGVRERFTELPASYSELLVSWV